MEEDASATKLRRIAAGTASLLFRRNLVQVVREVKEQHDLVLERASLIVGRSDRNPLAVRMEIITLLTRSALRT